MSSKIKSYQDIRNMQKLKSLEIIKELCEVNLESGHVSIYVDDEEGRNTIKACLKMGARGEYMMKLERTCKMDHGICGLTNRPMFGKYGKDNIIKYDWAPRQKFFWQYNN